MLAARTGALCVGTRAHRRRRSATAVCTLVHGGTTTVAHPEVVDAARDARSSLLVVAVKAYDLDAALDRVAPEALDGRRRPPAAERPRARRCDPRETRGPTATRADGRGREHRPAVEAFVAGAGGRRPARRRRGRRPAASRRRWREAALDARARAAPRSRDRRRRRRRRARRALGEGGPARGARGGDGGERPPGRRAPRRSSAWRARLRRRSARPARSPPPTESTLDRGRPMGDHRGHARRPHHVRGARRRRRAPDRARRDHGLGRPRRRAGSACRRRRSRALLEEAACRAR